MSDQDNDPIDWEAEDKALTPVDPVVDFIQAVAAANGKLKEDFVLWAETVGASMLKHVDADDVDGDVMIAYFTSSITLLQTTMTEAVEKAFDSAELKTKAGS